MNDAIRLVTQWGFPLVTIILIVLAASGKGLKGKYWMLCFLGGILAAILVFRVPELLFKLNIIDFDAYVSFTTWSIPYIGGAGLFIYCLLIPYLLAAQNSEAKNNSEMTDYTG